MIIRHGQTEKPGIRDSIAAFINRYKHGFWILSYMAFYLVGFMILENAGHRHYHIIHSVFDDLIPFCEYFIVPYYLWFVYITGAVCFFIFFGKDKTEYYKLCCSLAIGMTIFLMVSCVWPNAQDLRPTVFARDNVFVHWVQLLYKADTPTNILPSIHVYNSVVVFFAINKCRQLRRHKAVRLGCGILTVLIVLATMFLKQHSIVDASMGLLMSVAVQMFCDRAFEGETRTQTQVRRIGSR